LTRGDVDGGSCHETADRRERDELYDPAKPKQAIPSTINPEMNATVVAI